MAGRTDALSRAQMIGGLLATGTLAACGGGTTTTAGIAPGSVPAAPSCVAASVNPVTLDQIFTDPAFAALDKALLEKTFDPLPQIQKLYAGYYAQSGQQPQIGNLIRSIPSAGIVIQTPGTYAFAGNLQWTPGSAQSAAITITCSNVTLDLAGFTLTASVADRSQQTAGILVLGPVANPTLTNISIANGSVVNFTEYGVFATAVCGLAISGITVTGICLQNIDIRYLTPTGIQVAGSLDVAISGCTVSQMNVTTDSSAGIAVLTTVGATVSDCTVNGIVNNDGAAQGFSYIKSIDVTTTACTARNFQSHFNTNVLTSGHTVIGFCPIFCLTLSFAKCSASMLTGCCDDCHGMSVFLDGSVTVTGFSASFITDGVSASNSGAKATGLEVYGAGVTVTDSTATNIKAINPQDKQSTGFSAWGALITFQGCAATNVTVVDDTGESHGTGFGWAPDPRPEFDLPAYDVTYASCVAANCDVGFDTWYHVDSTWVNPSFTNCTTDILVQPGGMRTLSGNACSECSPPLITPLTNKAMGNTYPST